ncbi:MAG: phosphoribosylanthranilate isomerase [Endomicrobium sp.]|jgi:phosphoribosylanthranilate isomerase|nr:phosphoribosylanthranilate isomerase [Endomicrobium sp.]
MAKVKICGLANYNDALNATNLGADFLGFHFIKESPKKVSEKLIAGIVSKLPPFVTPVGVFLGQEENVIYKTVKKCGLKNIQFNGSETADFCKSVREKLGVKVFKYFKLEGDENALLKLQLYSEKVDYFVIDVSYVDVDTVKYNYELVSKAADLKVPLFISGNIKPEEVKEVLSSASPFGLDADTGIERLPKRKDYDKMNTFIRYAHGLK